jgi:hypothetical protein
LSGFGGLAQAPRATISPINSTVASERLSILYVFSGQSPPNRLLIAGNSLAMNMIGGSANRMARIGH